MSFVRLLRVDPGFGPDNVITARVTLPPVRYSDDARARSFLAELLQRLSVVPGVRQASATAIVSRVLAPENPPVPGWNQMAPGYLKAMRIPLLQGRDGFRWPGRAESTHKYFPRGDAIGARITRGIEVPGDSSKPDECTIVGVAGSVKTGNLAENNPAGQVYFSYKQYVPRTVHLVLRTGRHDLQLVAAIRRTLQQTDPEMPLFEVRTTPERLAASLRNQRAAMALCLMFATLALLAGANSSGWSSGKACAWPPSDWRRELWVRLLSRG